MPHAAIPRQSLGRAKRLRQTMTQAETLLWRHIRAHRIEGLGFRRQVPIRNFVADFVCHAARLIVELDGESHDFLERVDSDKRRDQFFRSQGFKVLRFTNDEVLRNLEGVVLAIKAEAAERRTAPPSPTLPHKGGGSKPASGQALQPHPRDTTS